MQIEPSLFLSLSRRCLEVRRALLPGDHIQVCWFLKGILAITILFRFQIPPKLIAKLILTYTTLFLLFAC